MRRFVLLAGIAALVAGGACTTVGTDPDAVVALSFDALPWPAVVANDTLRDDTGAVVTLSAIAYNADGDVVENAPLTFIALDTGVTVSPEGIVVSTTTAISSARLVAQASALQSRPLSLIVTVRPDSAALESAADDTLEYEPGGTATANTSAGIALRVLSNTIEPPANVRGWIVRYSAEFRGAPLDPADSTVAWFVDEAGRRSTVDTTGQDGRVSRRLRLDPIGLGAVPEDSVLVTASVQAYGQPLVGSPFRVVIHVRPR